VTHVRPVFGNIVLGLVVGSLASKVLGKSLTDCAAGMARGAGASARKIVNAFSEGFAGCCTGEAAPETNHAEAAAE
jgi:hypothetical protein